MRSSLKVALLFSLTSLILADTALARSPARDPRARVGRREEQTGASKDNLNKARSDYHSTVAQFGKQSPQAQAARQRLRDARRSFHSTRRQQSSPSTPSK